MGEPNRTRRRLYPERGGTGALHLPRRQTDRPVAAGHGSHRAAGLVARRLRAGGLPGGGRAVVPDRLRYSERPSRGRFLAWGAARTRLPAALGPALAVGPSDVGGTPSRHDPFGESRLAR